MTSPPRLLRIWPFEWHGRLQGGGLFVLKYRTDIKYVLYSNIQPLISNLQTKCARAIDPRMLPKMDEVFQQIAIYMVPRPVYNTRRSVLKSLMKSTHRPGHTRHRGGRRALDSGLPGERGGRQAAGQRVMQLVIFIILYAVIYLPDRNIFPRLNHHKNVSCSAKQSTCILAATDVTVTK